jgi:tripartite ATP-independent transporter DctP family solute receptor
MCKKKGFLVVVSLLATLMFIVSGCGGGNKGEKKEEKKVTLKLAHEMPENHPYHKGAMIFADRVIKKTNGAVTVQIFPNGTLGKQAQLVEGLAQGTIDLALTNTPVLEKYDPPMGVLVMPYIFRSWDHVYKAMDGEIGKEFNSKLEKKGITVLGWHEIGVTNINSIKPILTPDDIKGSKFRVQPGPVPVEVGRVLNTVVQTTAYGEVYTALQLGTIDSQLQSASNMRANKHYEVAKNLTIMYNAYALEPLSMSKRVFDRLSPAQQKALREAGQESAIEQRKLARKLQDEDTEWMVKNVGLKVHTPDLGPWEKAIQPAVANKFPDYKSLIEKIKAIK